MLDVSYAVYLVVTLALLAISASTLRWMLYAWQGPASQAGGPDPALTEARHSFSLLVPARHEERVLAATLHRLAAIDHPDFEVVVVVGHDDEGTRTVAESVAATSPSMSVVVDDSWPKTKPKALNTGLSACKGEIVGVFDAEDDVSLDVLRQVDAAFSRSGADVVQAGVQLVTPRAGWFAVRNCLEYFLWFYSRLHAHAARGFFPLGGNTVFVRRRLLQAAGGWDGECLAEDCELGIRLASLGARMAVSCDAHLSTREETPETLRSFVRQRTRWNQGYLQTLRKGCWRALPTRRQVALAAYVLAFPILQAASALLVPFSVATMVLVRLPVELSLAALLPALSSIVVVAAEVVALRELRRTHHLGASTLDYVRLVVTTIPYQLVLAYAAARATFRELVGQRGWEKTAHAGSHLGSAIPSPGEVRA